MALFIFVDLNVMLRKKAFGLLGSQLFNKIYDFIFYLTINIIKFDTTSLNVLT